MEYIIIICLFLILMCYFYHKSKSKILEKNEVDVKIYYNDPILNKIQQNDDQLFNIYKTAKLSELLNNNIRMSNIPIKKKKIAFVTFEDRSDKYIDLHNENVMKYCQKWNYDYLNYTEKSIDISPYWYKVLLINNILNTNKYDYVFWMDSDTIIKNLNIDIYRDILSKYDSDIYISPDNTKYDICNAGLFVIKNSPIGKQFMIDWKNEYKGFCRKNNQLLGKWALACYEQGQLNNLIIKKYAKYTTMLHKHIFYNNYICSNDVFIMHNYGTSPKNREKCFKKINL